MGSVVEEGSEGVKGVEGVEGVIQLWRSVHWRYYRQLRRSLAMRIMHAPSALSSVWPDMAD